MGAKAASSTFDGLKVVVADPQHVTLRSMVRDFYALRLEYGLVPSFRKDPAQGTQGSALLAQLTG